MRNATIADYRWLYDNTSYQEDGMKCARAAIPWLKTVLPNAESLLDFGGGRGGFAAWVSQYYPLVTAHTEDPATSFCSCKLYKYDIITCFDVLEHIDKDLSRVVLGDLLRRTDRLVFTICTDPDVVNIRGEEVQLHINREGPEWWVALLASIDPLLIISQYPCEHKSRHLFIVEKPCASSL